MSLACIGQCNSLLVECLKGSPLDKQKFQKTVEKLRIVDYIYLFFKDPMHFRASITRVSAERQEKLAKALVNIALRMPMPGSYLNDQFYVVYEDQKEGCYVYLDRQFLIISSYKLTEEALRVGQRDGMLDATKVQYVDTAQSYSPTAFKRAVMEVAIHSTDGKFLAVDNQFYDILGLWAHLNPDDTSEFVSIMMLKGIIPEIVLSAFLTIPNTHLEAAQGLMMLNEQGSSEVDCRRGFSLEEFRGLDPAGQEDLLLLYRFEHNLMKALIFIFMVWAAQGHVKEERLESIKKSIEQDWCKKSVICNLFQKKESRPPSDAAYELFTREAQCNLAGQPAVERLQVTPNIDRWPVALMA